ncbi:MAG: hypothetical protein ACFHX7_07095 [Pseudomonadota bacterium]
MKHAIKTSQQLLLCLALAAASSASAAVEHAIGFARDIQTGNLRYIEHHQWPGDGSHRIDYYTPDRSPLAFKAMTFPALPQHPDIQQADFSRNISAQARSVVDGIRITSQKDNEENSYLLTGDPDLVLDAGFDAWIKDNWTSLLDQGERRLRFAIVGVERTLAMNLRATPTAEGLVINITPANWFVSLLVPKMVLQYDQSRRITAFEGYSNLVPRKGEGKILVINYQHYQTADPLTRPLSAWLATAD